MAGNTRALRAVGVVLAGLLVTAALAPSAAAQDREFAFGIGYGHLFWGGANAGVLEEQGGLVLDGRLTWGVTPRPQPSQPQLRAGLGLGLAFYVSSDDNGNVDIVDGEVFANATDYTQLSVISPRFEIAWRQPIFDGHWYIEPAVAAELIVGNYTAGQEFFWFVDENVNRWRVGGGGKAFLRLAYTRDRWAVGAQGSYGYGWLDFDDGIGGELRQASIGLFFAHQF